MLWWNDDEIRRTKRHCFVVHARKSLRPDDYLGDVCVRVRHVNERSRRQLDNSIAHVNT